jgi:beta-lactamase regulating signal transducer with metallopeptidase domain
MGITFHNYLSPYSFMMGVLWFNAFVCLGIVMRKLKYPIKFSVIPLLLLLVLSVMRMFVAIDMPGATVVLSERIYPAVIGFARIEILSLRVFGLPINVAGTLICVWITGIFYFSIRYFYSYISNFRPVMKLFVKYNRDEYAESLLRDIIGSDKHFHVYRNKCFNAAIATALKPYIILPDVEFSPDELRVILLHEWKHIQDKDYLTSIIMNIICFVFWWNPMVYVLKRNFVFVQELKSDQFAVSDNKDFKHYLKGLRILNNVKKNDAKMECEQANTFIGNDGDGIEDRLNVLALKGDSRKKRILTNLCYSIVIFALFIVSYMFTIHPAFWDAYDVSVPIEDFTEEYTESGGIFKAGENFLIDNGDGTFSLYIDGQFAIHVNDTDDIINWIPIYKKEDG